MKFNYTLKTLHAELERLWGMGEEFPSDLFEKSNTFKRIVEIKAAIRLIEGYDFKLGEK